MKWYWVEGIFLTKQGFKHSKKTGEVSSTDLEPFSKLIWANSPKEAGQLATEMIGGGQWTKGPKVSEKTEEQRMRAMGAPELPGFDQL